jgi:hypothetical protein
MIRCLSDDGSRLKVCIFRLNAFYMKNVSIFSRFSPKETVFLDNTSLKEIKIFFQNFDHVKIANLSASACFRA